MLTSAPAVSSTADPIVAVRRCRPRTSNGAALISTGTARTAAVAQPCCCTRLCASVPLASSAVATTGRNSSTELVTIASSAAAVTQDRLRSGSAWSCPGTVSPGYLAPPVPPGGRGGLAGRAADPPISPNGSSAGDDGDGDRRAAAGLVRDQGRVPVVAYTADPTGLLDQLLPKGLSSGQVDRGARETGY